MDDVLDPPAELDAPPAPRPRAVPIESRFLFVDVAAMRAKQLRRGAIVRLDELLEEGEVARALPHKAERIAMRLMIGVQSAVVANNFFATR